MSGSESKSGVVVPKLREVEGSSNIAAVGHEGGDLYVRFLGGGLYRYAGCGQEHERGILGAKSAGKYFFANVKNAYRGERVDEGTV